MTAPVTYADALAACVAAFGEPTEHGYAAGVEHALWDLAPGRFVALEDCPEGCDLLAHDPEDERMWLLRGAAPKGFDAPLTPLPDAIAAAGAWLRGER